MMAFELGESKKQEILKLARNAIEVFLESGKEPPVPQGKFWMEPRGAFVTLTSGGYLRGCIGYIEAMYPLGVTIIKAAIAAAVEDPRFPAVTLPEMDLIHLEVSLLSPVQSIQSVDEVEVGVHGLIVTLGRFRGLLLPQVATDNEWDRTTFLEHTCLKAGLPKNAWESPDVRIEVFSAEVFGE